MSKTYQRTIDKYDKKEEIDGASTEDAAPRQNSTNNTDHPPVLEESLPHLEKKPKSKKNNTLPKVKKKNFINNKAHNNLKDPCLANDENSKPGEILETPRSTSRDQLSDASSHASLERGYECDSESGDERGSEPECDLFNSKATENNFITKKNNPGHSQNCRSPPVLPPIHPVHNGTHHPEPSTAVAAVTASASPSNTSSTMVVGSTSPREPQIGSPAVIPVSCSSPASPPSGVVPASPPPFLQKGPPSVNAKDSASSSKLLSNGYEFVSDTSPPSPLAAAKLLSPSKFLHKRVPPVPSCRDSVAALNNKPTINVYDFVSDHSAPSSPDGVIFISQSKFHHKGISPPASATANKDTPSVDKVSNGHSTNMCVSPPPMLSSPVIQNSHNKNALDMSIKANMSMCKTEQQQPPTILPPSASGDLRLQSPGQSRSSYSIPYSTSQPVRKMTSSPRMSPLTLPTSLSSPAHSAPSVLPVSPAGVISMRTTTSASVTMSNVSQTIATRCRSPIVTASHSNTPTPIPARDTHSSHSNSSLSSLSQLSTPVHKDRDGGGSRSHSNSSNMAPSVSAALTSASAYASASSLAGLVFSKPQSWSGNSSTTNTISATITRSSPAPPRASPALSSSGSTSLPLPPTLPPAHHTSPFSNHAGPPPPPLLPVASHHNMFTTGSLTPTLPLEATAGPSPYRAETLFQQHNEYKKHPDFLRRELDTRFLASQDHSIPIPPPPYMQSEVQHHSQMHQQGPFIAPPPLGAPMVTQQPSHLYEKYPKLDSSLYRRPSIGLSNYPPVSSLFAPGGGASTPFVPPAHLAALQPKINSVSKTKSMKPGKWCAMHVRIAWEIYNHQQKQKQAEAHKAGIALASVKPPDHMHAANHLFCSLPRTHEMSPFSSSLLSAAASGHPRSFETSSHHSTFLNPTPAHLGPFARPGYSTFAGAAPGFTGLGPLGLPGPSMLGADLRTSCLPGQDPWAQRTSLPFGGGSPWGGLKEEAERDRLQQERKREEERQKRAEQEKREREERERRDQERREQERREQERRELERQEQERKEQERKEKERREQERRKEMERREMERREHERREQERQKERDREIRLHHQLQKNSIVMNGDIRDHHLHHPQHHHPHHHAVSREWERARDSRELPRSPIVPNNPIKYEGALERHVYPQAPPRLDIKIKQERKDDEPIPVSRSSRSGDDRIRKRPGSIPDGADPVSLVSRSVVHNSVPLGLNSIDHSRLMSTHGLVPSPAKDHHSQTSPLWGPLTPSPTVSSIQGSTMDPYRMAGRAEHDLRRFDPLVMSPRDSNNSDLSRHVTNVLDLERAAAYDRAKLLPPPLRTNESPYATPPTLPPASASSFFSPPVSPFLNSLCNSSNRTKPGPPGMLNGLPPPLIPCTFPVQNHTGFPAARTSSPMTTHKLLPGGPVLNLQDPYFTKDRREVNGHPSDFDAHLRL
ncbi:autism susceptibility gene 2 protein [Caerostris darwini]|uniref:Autism susceptibility gene 2 protein n=1 Tax=Caerostris darwini TaxID=1538125 RepID=A0AAV4TLT3_9ARAC|nr:autism susceptibility gene 2 protein [Caerostris darwini]